MSTDDHAQTIEDQMRADMMKTLHRNGLDVAEQTWLDIIVDELVADGMHHVTALLTDVRWEE